MIAQSWFGRCWQWKMGSCVALVGVLSVGVSKNVLAQIVPDNTLGAEGSVVTPNVNINGIQGDRIDGGATRGANLFHSFQDFNVGEGRGAYFANPTGIENILTRVTGSNLSNIFGRLGVLGEANLFLLNPNGIVFGPNASLDIQGSFVATTAERIQLGDSDYFSAAQPQMSSLLSVSPGALFFNAVANQPSLIINQGNLSTGKNLTLSAGNLDLQGQLLAGGDLTLQAQDTVKVRDTVATPFLARTGGNLTIIGNGGIDILALNHPTQTPFVSGGNLSLISDGVISGDARFSSGGSFSIKSVSGGLANFFSYYDPIISAEGDVDVVANYTGTSLLVEAMGNIRFQGDINITGPDTSTLPPGPDTTALSRSSALIMRSGQSTLAYGGVNSVGAPNYGTGAVPEGITIGGNVIVQPFNGAGGIVKLTAASGNVSTQLISTNGQQTRNLNNDANGGTISLTAQDGSISTGDLLSYSFSSSRYGNAGNGGAISLTAANGSITTGNLYSFSSSRKAYNNAGNGGAIRLSAANDINITGRLTSSSYSEYGNAGNGGAIRLSAANDIKITGGLGSSSYSELGNVGNGGAIRLSAVNDINITGGLYSYSASDSSNAGNGGGISLSAANGSITAGFLNSFSISYSNKARSDSGNGGAIRLSAARDINYSGSLRSASESFYGNAGNGGAIHLSAANDINIIGNSHFDSSSNSELGNKGNGGGGAIRLSAGRDINSSGYFNSDSSSDYGNAGNGGAIHLSAANDINIIRSRQLNSSSYSKYGNAENGGAIRLSAANDIKVMGDLYSYSYSQSGTAGQGGAISLIARGGDISGRRNPSTVLSSFSVSDQGTAGNGGNVTLKAKKNVSNLEILTLSSDSQSGTVQVTGLGDLLLRNTNILTSKQVTVQLPYNKFITINVGGKGQSGNVDVTSSGNVTFDNSFIQSDTKGSDNAGNVAVSSPGLITFNNSFIRSNTSNTGAAGSIGIEAGQGITLIGSRSQLFAGTTNQGKAGDITLTTPQLTLQNGTNIATTTASSANAGNITLQSHPNGQNLNINLAQETSISASTSNQGTGGNIEIKAPNAITIQGQSTITTETTGAGNAGKIQVTSRNLDIQQTELSTSTTGSGNAGNITLDTSTLTVARGAKVFATTNGNGNSGTITANASTAMNLGIGVEDFSPVLSVETSSTGQPGSIFINTPSLTLSNTARITATATNTATNPQGGGSITLNASTMDLAGVVGVFAETQGQTPAGTLTLQPYQNQSTLNLTLAPQSQVSASTTGSGKGGNLIVQAPEAITIQGPGQLAVQTTGDGAAGDLRIDTQRLTIADGATISASTSSPNPAGIGGNITINATESFNLTNQARLLAQSTGAGRAGDVTINTPQLNLDQAQVSVETSGAGAAGDVEITTETLTLERGAKVSATATATATTNEPGGSVNVNASQINLSGNTSGLFAQTQGAAPAGSLTLKPFNNGQTLSVNLQDNPQISASTSDSGEGGSLRVTAPEAVTIRGLGQLSVETTGAGKAGGLTIETQKLNISDGATVSASTSSPYASGTGGNLTINATQSFNLTNLARLLAQSNGAAPAGNVAINTEQLTANNGSITTSATARSSGRGGSIDVNASQINLKGTEIGLLAETQGVAPAGSLTLQPFNNGQDLTINLQDNAKISAATSGSGQGGSLRVTAPETITIRGLGQLSVETTGDGAAGNLTIDTQRLTIADGATISASTFSPNPDGVGGNLTINATQSFNLTNLARLLARSTGVAPSGNITVNTGQLTARDGSIETSATKSAGGAITITASGIRLFGDSDIRTDVAKGAGGGGNINLTANSIIAFGDSDILAYAADGKGGDITFKTPIFFGFAYSPAPKGTDPDPLDHNNQVDINATGAVEGVITIPDVSFIQNSLTELPSNQINTDSLLANSCIIRRNQPTRGSFTITGTGGLPQRPGDAQMSSYPTVDIETLPSDSTPSNTNPNRPWQKGDPIVEPQGVYRLPNGKLVMSRECPQ